MDCVQAYRLCEGSGEGRPHKDSVSVDFRLMDLNSWDAQDSARQRKAVGRKTNQRSPKTPLLNYDNGE